MATSGAKGNITQIRQMAGMRGLMSDPSGRIIELPIRVRLPRGPLRPRVLHLHARRPQGSRRHGAPHSRLRYLTRRLIDVAQDVIILEDDCGTTRGVWIEREDTGDAVESLRERIIGRYAAMAVVDEETGEVIGERNEEITEAVADEIDARKIERVHVRSPLTCEARARHLRPLLRPRPRRAASSSSSAGGRHHRRAVDR